MSVQELRELLDQVPDTRELVIRRAPEKGEFWNALYSVWSDAHEEAEAAYMGWVEEGGADAYAAYRAAADREDAAQDALGVVTLVA